MRLLWLFLLFAVPVAGQELILQKEPVKSRLVRCFYHIYNSDTVAFRASTDSLRALIPTHPANNLLIALSIYWSKYPLNLDGDEIIRMKETLNTTIEKCHNILELNEDDFEIKYIDMIAHAVLALSYSRDSQFLKAAGEAKKAYNYFRDGFELMKKYNEFYFSSGLYSYYREKYPEVYPIYKTIIWMFRSGDKEEGLRLMDKAYRETVFAKAEAAHYIGHILLRYEMKPEKAIEYQEYLATHYPGNLFFRANYIETLLFLGRYDEAEMWVESFPGSEHSFYQMAKRVFEAILLEKRSEYVMSEIAYNQAIEISNYGSSEEINNLKSLAFSGLARLSLQRHENQLAVEFYRLAYDLVKFEIYKKEPSEYLVSHDPNFKY